MMQIDNYIDRLLEAEGQDFVDKLARRLSRRGFGGELVTARLTMIQKSGWNKYDVTLEIGDDFSSTEETHTYGGEALLDDASYVFSLGGWKQEASSTYLDQTWTVLSPSAENIAQLKALWRKEE